MSKELFEYKEEFLSSRAGQQMLRDKVQELDYERRAYFAERGEELKAAIREKDPEKKEWLMWLIKGMDETLAIMVKRQKKFEFILARATKGAQIFKHVDIEPAKSYPIGDLIDGEPKSNAPNRATYLCPLHNEKSGSFTWYKEENKYKCFGCGSYGDAIDLYQKMNHCNFMEAVGALLSMV